MVSPVKASEARPGPVPSVHPASAGSTQRATTVAGASCVTDGRSRTMFSMPLAYPSTLDRRCTASYVEERWSPALLRSPEIRRQKQRLIQQRIRMRGLRRGTFLSKAGPRVSVVAFHVEHHPSVLFDLAPTTTRATLSGRPRYGADASKTLACMPPSEGFPVVRPALGAIRPEGGRTCDGEGRSGKEHLNVGSQCHVCPRYTGLYLKPNTGCTQGSSHNSNERSLKCTQRISGEGRQRRIGDVTGRPRARVRISGGRGPRRARGHARSAAG
jgi:hypothetical protein